VNIETKHKNNRHNINANCYHKTGTSSVWSHPHESILNLLDSYDISIEIIDHYSSQFSAIPVSSQFNKAKTNILLSTNASSKAMACQMFVDDDLKYLGRDAERIKAFTGICSKNWRRLSVEPIFGNINECLCKALEIVDSPITHKAYEIVTSINEQNQKSTDDLSDSLLTNLGEIINPEIAVKTYKKVINKGIAEEIAIIVTNTECPNNVLLWGDHSGVGKDLLMLAAVHLLFKRNHIDYVVKISAWKIGIGSIFPAEQDSFLNLLLTEAINQRCLLLIQDIDVCLTGSEISKSSLCSAIDSGLRFIASVRTPAAAARLAQDMSIVRRLVAIKIEEPSTEEMFEVLQQIAKESPVKVQPSAIHAILRLSQKDLNNGSEPASSIGLLTSAIHQAEWKKTQVDPDLVYSLFRGQWPDN